MVIHSIIAGAGHGVMWAHRPVEMPPAVRRGWNALPAPELRRFVGTMGRQVLARPVVASVLQQRMLAQGASAAAPPLLHRAVQSAQSCAVSVCVGLYGIAREAFPPTDRTHNPHARPNNKALRLAHAQGASTRFMDEAGAWVEMYLTTLLACMFVGATLGFLNHAVQNRPARANGDVVDNANRD